MSFAVDCFTGSDDCEFGIPVAVVFVQMVKGGFEFSERWFGVVDHGEEYVGVCFIQPFLTGRRAKRGSFFGNSEKTTMAAPNTGKPREVKSAFTTALT